MIVDLSEESGGSDIVVWQWASLEIHAALCTNGVDVLKCGRGVARVGAGRRSGV
jgi:hypothetical protein